MHETAQDMIQSTLQGVQHMQIQPRIEDDNHDDDDDDDEDLTIDDDSDSGDFLDEDESDVTTPSSKSTASNNSGERMMKVHKFAAYHHNHSHIQATYVRPHFCNLADKTNPDKMCGKRFVRPEHLRRHKNSVHVSDPKIFSRCKVPQCNRSFSRGDNLRDHYFTHVERGGRVGKNIKMGLEDLKKILGAGTKNKELYIKLVKKYKKHARAKRRAAGPQL
jgi:hypothetical protein